MYDVDAAEHTIQSFKNHFIAGLATVNIQLWNELLVHVETSLNLLCQS